MTRRCCRVSILSVHRHPLGQLLDPADSGRGHEAWKFVEQIERGTSRERVLSSATDQNALLMRQLVKLFCLWPSPEVDQGDVGVLALAVEHDLVAVRSNVERSHRRDVVRLGQLATLHRGEIEHPRASPSTHRGASALLGIAPKLLQAAVATATEPVPLVPERVVQVVVLVIVLGRPEHGGLGDLGDDRQGEAVRLVDAPLRL